METWPSSAPLLIMSPMDHSQWKAGVQSEGDRWTDGRMDRLGDRQTKSLIDRWAECGQTNKQTKKKTVKKTNQYRPIDRHTDRETDRETDRQTAS